VLVDEARSAGPLLGAPFAAGWTKRASLLEVAERFIAQGYDALPVS
jgi:hypothetical protein